MLTLEEAQARLAAMRAGLAEIQIDLARQEGAIQAMEWVVDQLKTEDDETANAETD